MAQSVRSLLHQALELSDDDREFLALALLDSVHGPRDQGNISAAWSTEIRKRVDDYRAGRVGAVPWTELRDELATRAKE